MPRFDRYCPTTVWAVPSRVASHVGFDSSPGVTELATWSEVPAAAGIASEMSPTWVASTAWSVGIEASTPHAVATIPTARATVIFWRRLFISVVLLAGVEVRSRLSEKRLQLREGGAELSCR